MKKIIFVASIFCFLFIGCQKDKTPEMNCIDETLAEYDMVPNQGQELDKCDAYLNLYQYEDQYYFILGSYCVDMVTYPFDCEGNFFCTDVNGDSCKIFHENAAHLGIVGVKP